MSTAEIKQQLHNLIEKADSELLELAYSILSKSKGVLNLNQSQIEELEKRYAAHLENPSKGSSWEEVRERLSRSLSLQSKMN